MKLLKSALFAALFFGPLHARAQALVAADDLMKSSLHFLQVSQVTAADADYVPGEWRSQVYSSPLPVLVGVGNPLGGDEEPSAFTTASIVNALAVIYQDNPQLTQIPTLINRAVPVLERYREGDLYNFYPAKIVNGVRVHQAGAMTLSPLWKGFTNIPQDADTTSATWAAKYFALGLHGRALVLPETVKQSFSQFRDLDRESHYYNERENLRQTGAFLTWLYDENDPKMPRFYFADPEEGARIPFNRNDVDCIVNLNVLRVLALTKNSDLPGRDQACGVVEYLMQTNGYEKCGIYYPNTYNFGYSAAMADRAGESCLRPYSNNLVNFVLSHQRADGGWYNDGNSEAGDRVQSTAFALHALVQFADLTDGNIMGAVQQGERFLINSAQISSGGDYYWPGETFFTATAVARSLVDWRSDAFTTVVALSAIAEVERVSR